MVADSVLSLVWGLVQGPLRYIPDLNINYESLANSTSYQFFQAALYLLPMGTVGAIFTITAALWVLRAFVAFFRTLWASLPIL